MIKTQIGKLRSGQHFHLDGRYYIVAGLLPMGTEPHVAASDLHGDRLQQLSWFPTDTEVEVAATVADAAPGDTFEYWGHLYTVSENLGSVLIVWTEDRGEYTADVFPFDSLKLEYFTHLAARDGKKGNP